MRIEQKLRKLGALVDSQSKINLNPLWQRGPAWQEARQVLLIDSILRGMDIPKIYLRALGTGGNHEYDAVDGQQRLRSVWAFRANELALNFTERLEPIDGADINGLRYSELSEGLRDRFDSFEVSVAEITEATNDEVTRHGFRSATGSSRNGRIRR